MYKNRDYRAYDNRTYNNINKTFNNNTYDNTTLYVLLLIDNNQNFNTINVYF